MNVTALTVSLKPARHQFVGIQSKCLHGRLFTRAADVQKAWFDAVKLVKTSHFFFIDDDDSLPENYHDVLKECLSAKTAIAYTNESVNGKLRASAAYSQSAHLKNPGLVHHLVLCDTKLALAAIARLPAGHFWPEMLLYWEMAKLGSATYIDRIGYLWNKKSEGLHKQWFTVLGMNNSHSWCSANP